MGSPTNKPRMLHHAPCNRNHQIGALLLVAATFFLTRLLDGSLGPCPAILQDHLSVPLVRVTDGGSLSWPTLGYGTHLSLKIYVYEEDEIDGLKELMRGRDSKISSDACVKGQWGTQVIVSLTKLRLVDLNVFFFALVREF